MKINKIAGRCWSVVVWYLRPTTTPREQKQMTGRVRIDVSLVCLAQTYRKTKIGVNALNSMSLMTNSIMMLNRRLVIVRRSSQHRKGVDYASTNALNHSLVGASLQQRRRPIPPTLIGNDTIPFILPNAGCLGLTNQQSKCYGLCFPYL